MTWVRKAQRVSQGVYTSSRQVAFSSRRAASTRSAGRTSAKGSPSVWANWVRRVSIWCVRRVRLEWGIEDLLVWGGRKHPYSQARKVFVSISLRRFALQPQEVPFDTQGNNPKKGARFQTALALGEKKRPGPLSESGPGLDLHRSDRSVRPTDSDSGE